MSSVSGSGRSPGEGNGNSFQYSCLKNPMGRAAWQATYSLWADTTEWLRVRHNWATKHTWVLTEEFFKCEGCRGKQKRGYILVGENCQWIEEQTNIEYVSVMSAVKKINEGEWWQMVRARSVCGDSNWGEMWMKWEVSHFSVWGTVFQAEGKQEERWVRCTGWVRTWHVSGTVKKAVLFLEEPSFCQDEPTDKIPVLLERASYQVKRNN